MKDRIDTSLGNKELFMMLAMPALLVQIFSGIIAIGDRIIGAFFIGEEALAIVTLTFPVLMFGIAFAVMIMAGLGIEINYLLGKNEREKASGLATFVLIVITALSVTTALILLTFSSGIIDKVVLNTDYRKDALEYFRYISLCFPFMAIGYTISTCIQADGGAKYNMFGHMILSIGNILLNVLFVIALDLEVRGLGLATLISSVLFFVFNLFYFLSKRNVSFGFGKIYVSFKEFGTILYNGLSEFLSIGADGFSMIAINFIITSNLSSDYFIMYSTVSLFISVSIYVLFGGIHGISPVISKCHGENNLKRANSFVFYTAIRTIIVAVGIYFITFILIKPLSGLFVESKDIVNDIRVYFLMLGLPALLSFTSIFASGYLSAIKQPLLSLITSVVKPLILLPILTYIFVTSLGVNGLSVSKLLSELLFIPFMFLALYLSKRTLSKIKN